MEPKVRDRMRTPVQTAFLEVVIEISRVDFERSCLTAASFSKRAGLSRQALHKSHPEIVHALNLLFRALGPAPKTDEELQQVLKETKRELTEKKAELRGSTGQNLELIIQIEELKLQLKKKGLTLVPRRTVDDW
jgi:hypothetical protein